MTQPKVPPKIAKQDFALPEGLSIRQAVILPISVQSRFEASIVICFSDAGGSPDAVRIDMAHFGPAWEQEHRRLRSA